MAKVEYRTGNILDDDADAVVIPVNTAGVMGAGLAKEFAAHYPHCEIRYKALCRDGLMHPGEIHYETMGNNPNHFAIYLPTKRHWKEPSRLPDVAMALGYLAAYWHSNWTRSVRTIAIPALGCGLGGLDWKDVKPLLLQFASLLPDTFTVRLYAPQGAKEPA